MRRFVLMSIVPLLVACSAPAASTPAAPPPAQATNQPAAKPAAEAKLDAKPQAAAPAAPKATIAPPSENHGIALGQPFKSGANGSVVLVTNTTDQVMTFTVKTEYRKGADSVTFTSTVSDLLPKQSWPAFAAGERLLPGDPDSISVAVDRMISAGPTSEKAEAAKKVTMSEPKKAEGSDSVTVEVTNTDAKMHNVTLRSAYVKGDDMVAHGEGDAAGLKPGETRVVRVRPVTAMKPYDRVAVTLKVT